MNGDQVAVSDSELEEDEDTKVAMPPTPDDSVYCNKQLTAYLLKCVCSNRRKNRISDSSNSSSGSSRNNANNNAPLNNNTSSSSRSHTPPDDEQEAMVQIQVQDHATNQQQLQLQQQQDLADGGYLSASSGSGFNGLSATSPAYVSPFAMSPLTEGAAVRSAWTQPAISLDVIKSERTAELVRVLARLCDEFEDRLHGSFDSFSSRLDTAPATIRESVLNELEILFYDDNVHWGRIIAVFVLAKEICDKCLAEGRPELASAVQQWIAEFIDQHLWRWVRQNQGWYGLIKFYQQTGGDLSNNVASSLGSANSLWQSVGLLLTLSAVSVAIALTASYFRR